MKIRLLALLSPMLLLLGCVSPTSYDFDHAALGEMTAYRTFALDSRDARGEHQDVVLSPIVDRRLERAIERELLEKGFEKTSAAPDFRVSFNTVTRTRTRVSEFGQPAFRGHPFYGYRSRQFDIDEYEEGTFLINIVDTASGQLVWRGAYMQRLGWSAPDEAEAQKIVHAILKDFPPSG